MTAIDPIDVYGSNLFDLIKESVFAYLCEYYHYFEETVDACESDFDKEDYSPYKTLNSHLAYIVKYAERNIGEYVIENQQSPVPIEDMFNWLTSWQFNGDANTPSSITHRFIYYQILIIDPQLFITELREIKASHSHRILK